MTTSTLTVRPYATAADVRKFAVENNLPAGGSRGKLPAETIKAYNRTHSVKFVYRAYKPTKVIVSSARGGKKRTYKVNPADARALLVANGAQVGTRGRLTAAQYDLALTLA